MVSTDMSMIERGGNVVDDDRNADRVVDRLEVLVQALLRRLVVIGRRRSAPRRRRPSRRACERSIASAVELEPAPAITGTRPLASSTHHSTTCLCSSWDERRALAGGADRNEAVGAFGDLPVHQVAERLLVDASRS